MLCWHGMFAPCDGPVCEGILDRTRMLHMRAQRQVDPKREYDRWAADTCGLPGRAHAAALALGAYCWDSLAASPCWHLALKACRQQCRQVGAKVGTYQLLCAERGAQYRETVCSALSAQVWLQQCAALLRVGCCCKARGLKGQPHQRKCAGVMRADALPTQQPKGPKATSCTAIAAQCARTCSCCCVCLGLALQCCK